MLAKMRRQEARIESDLKRDFPNGHTKADVEDLWAKHEQKFSRNEQLDIHTRNYADDVAAAFHAIAERAPSAAEQREQPVINRFTSDERAAIQASVQERIVRPNTDIRTERQPALADIRSVDRDRTPAYFREQASELKARGGRVWDIVKDDMETLRASRAVQTPEKLSRNLDAIAAEREVIRVSDPERAGLLNVRALALAGLINEAAQRRCARRSRADPRQHRSGGEAAELVAQHADEEGGPVQSAAPAQAVRLRDATTQGRRSIRT